MKVRQDDKGLYINSGLWRYRPGEVPGYSHVYYMGEGGLKVGDKPKVSRVTGAPLIRIKTTDGRVIYWADEYEHNLRSN